ncbi:conserved hypothetical protein [Candidatus Koribacter versatilis Ellin345]|uniref:Rv2525c-like glycoside hydrolase-like domain-containing protein n=1 Tax=Koribacter versatilis (strain Ellin345) TaxID=204669 RepID=Q1IMM8_KORVE|nr:glycoside hydrolase domain-containing protein [Candidatus Koribacter versatilis]ABF41872.1 conserved hypothetical protein [Candidatus Koribacter versatilis Ellin345]
MTEDALLRNPLGSRTQPVMRKTKIIVSVLLAIFFGISGLAVAQESQPYHLGFDRNVYPGDDLLPALHKTFEWTGYWLNNPPGANRNTWAGKREMMKAAGFGFAVLYNGRLYNELKGKNPAQIGQKDGRDAAARANAEGFRAGAIIFIDQEQGGRMLEEQQAYLHAWFDAVIAAGFKAGVYCSGMAAEGVVTAKDIHDHAQGRKIAIWAYNDACSPSRGCYFPKNPPSPAKSGIPYAEIWQYAQSPRRGEAKACPKNYNADGNCYPPELPVETKTHVDLNTATSADPSQGR